MSTEENKAVVRRFINEALSGRNLAAADELLAPTYVNRMTGADLAGFKGMLAGMSTALAGIRIDIEDLVAEGDAVMGRWKLEATHSGSLMGEAPTGKQIALRGLTYYRLSNGRIVEDDPIANPNLMQVLGIQMPAQSGR